MARYQRHSDAVGACNSMAEVEQQHNALVVGEVPTARNERRGVASGVVAAQGSVGEEEEVSWYRELEGLEGRC